MRSLIWIAALLSGCGGGNSGDSAPPVGEPQPPTAFPYEKTITSANNSWSGDWVSLDASRFKVSISFRVDINSFAADDIVQANASYSGQGNAEEPTTKEWALQDVSGQTLNHTVFINAGYAGPWAVQPQIFLRGNRNQVTFTNIVTRIERAPM